MKKIGIIADLTYENKSKIKDILHKIKTTHGNSAEIVTRGNLQGGEKYVKKYALEFGLQYKEFNPSHTKRNLYSAMNESFYGKSYAPYNYKLRDKIFCKYIDVCFCLSGNSKVDSLLECTKQLETIGKKYVVLN